MVTAAQIQYRDEFIAGFEQGQSLLMDACVNEAQIKGNQAVFLVADSGNAEAQTRGVNGRIPSRNDNLAQPTATLEEWHDKATRSGFDLFGSQGDGRKIMQATTMQVVNRKVDQIVLDAMSAATQTTTTATTASVNLVMRARTILGNNAVPTNDGMMSMVVTPAFMAYIIQAPEFSSGDYVDAKPFAGSPKVFKWFGITFIEHPNLAGAGTSSSTCYLWHKNSMGCAVDTAGMDVDSGYNGEDQYNWARVSTFMGSKLIQNTGIVKVLHNDAAMSA